ncbi:ATP-binding protein [Dactylosporangium sp. CA-152071]|uniref:ATP-binding protein n=1 Tax=Dactylosporangium sp. CA-152071 TaxID=3239933 RepID=UPI003D8EFFEF
MITADERRALEALDFNPAPTPDDVWRPSPYDVPELHAEAAGRILRGVNKARTGDDASPVGVAVQGRSGSGKTHLLGALREKIQRDGGFFFLVGLANGKTFWESTALCMIEGLGRDAIGFTTQLKTFLYWLTPRLELPGELRQVIAGDGDLTRAHLDAFAAGLRRLDWRVGQECQDTARALVLWASRDFEAQDVGYAHLISMQGDLSGRHAWGLSPAVREPRDIVRDISRLTALTLAPTVIAFDQIDTIFAQSAASLTKPDRGVEEELSLVFGPMADGLLMLRDITQRTLTVVSCLPDTWEMLRRCAPMPVLDRFTPTTLPDMIDRPDLGEAIITKRFAVKYAEQRFVPPYPTWPIRPQAFTDALYLTPRKLLNAVDRHVQSCLDRDEVTELDRLIGGAEPVGGRPVPKPVGESALETLDALFAALVAQADCSGVLEPQTENAEVPRLLAAGIASWIDEQAPTGIVYKQDPLPSATPALHARLIQVLDEATENEAHWAFRAVASKQANAVISRVKAACTMAGLDVAVPQRRLVLLRNGPWPTGPVTTGIIKEFRAAGGVVHPLTSEDLRVFSALQELRAIPRPDLQEWLASRRHASRTKLFTALLEAPASDPGPPVVVATAPATMSEPAPTSTPQPGPDAAAVSIGLGKTADGHRAFRVDLESLRRHTVIFAGSGSGKTVLIRRLVEECARKGVSAIVLDPNNDLARLGDPWPEPPAGWGPGDVARARDYLEHTEVVVWTPRVSAGRPLAFQPLPDFTSVRNSPDEFDAAIEAAVAALVPRAGVAGPSKVAQQGRAVLTEALRAYAKSGAAGLRGFTDFLAELPAGVSQMAKSEKLALDAAETLKAAMVTDPLFGGQGVAADPGTLLTPPTGMRARVSVINLAGLNSDEQRQSFVNQLQMALFAWIKRHPAGDRPLGGLFVMDEAQTLAPSSGSTPCTASTIALASQARKYGLGLVFATQAPKGLHNQISGNATTQFFGLLNSPAQIDAARELALAKGGRLPDIGLLGSGEFYAAGEGFSFVKVRTPLCLSHHPKAPLSPEEVVARASGV